MSEAKKPIRWSSVYSEYLAGTGTTVQEFVRSATGERVIVIHSTRGVAIAPLPPVPDICKEAGFKS